MIIDESFTAKGYTPAAQVPAVFGQERVVRSITVHHWGSLGQTHDGVVAFFCTTGPGSTSAHYVASAGRVHCIVNPDDAAWHAGNATGNATSVGIECRPEATDGDYATVAELIRYLRGIYGDVPLRPHSSWSATACPGVWDLDRLDRLARAGTITTPSPQSTPSVQEYIMSWDTKIQEYAKDGKTKAGIKTAAFIMGNLNQWVSRILDGQRVILAETRALREVVAQAAAAGPGASIDYVKVEQSVKNALAESVVSVDVNVTGK